MVLLHQQAEAVGQLELLHRVVAGSFGGEHRLGCGAGGQEREERAVLWREVFRGDALEIGGGDTFDGGEVALGEVQVIGRKPTATEILRLALHGLARGERGGDELLYGFAQLVRRNRGRLHLLDFLQHGVARGEELVRVHHRAQAEQAGLAGAVGPGLEGVDQALLLAHRLVKARAAAMP